MSTDDPAVEVIRALESLAVPYMVVGSYSTNVHGIPRSTGDADFVVVLDQVTIGQIADKLGPRFKLNPQMGFETITGTPRYLFELPGEDFSVELFMLTDDPHNQQRFERRVRQRMLGIDAWVPTAEDVVIMKLRWSARGNRPKDMADVEDVMSVQANTLDWPYIRSWADRHGTRELLEKACQTVRDRGIDID